MTNRQVGDAWRRMARSSRQHLTSLGMRILHLTRSTPPPVSVRAPLEATCAGSSSIVQSIAESRQATGSAGR